MTVTDKPNAIRSWLFKFTTVISLLTLQAAGVWPSPPAMAQVISERPDPPPVVHLEYANVPDGTKALSLVRETPNLRIANNTGAPVLVLLEARSISGGVDETSLFEKVSLRPFDKASLPIDSKLMPVNPDSAGFASQLLVTGQIFDAAGQLIGKTRAPSLFYHRDERGTLLAYRTLINSGLVGRVGRLLPKELLETMSNGDSIGVGKPGPAPNHEGIYKIGNDYELRKYEGVKGLLGSWVQVCVTLKVNYTDNGFGEDFWTNNQDKFVPGVWVRVRDHDQNVVFEGFTADGYENNDFPGGDTIGCIPWQFTTNRNDWTLHVQSRAKVRGNDIEVYRVPNAETLTSWVTTVDLNAGQNFVSIPYETRESSVLAAAAHAIFLHNGGMVIGNYRIHTGVDNLVSFHAGGNHKIYMTDAGSRHKFDIAHEMGHALMFERLGANFGVHDSSHNAASPCDSPIPNSHTMASKEFNLTALHEGFADFYAVDTWNNHNQQNGVFVSWGAAYDADPPLGNIWMRYHCSSPYIGYGNETDWMRFFWDFHTGSVSPVDPVPFNDIVGIIAFASPLPLMGAYNGLADVVGIYNLGIWEYEFFYWADMNGITY